MRTADESRTNLVVPAGRLDLADPAEFRQKSLAQERDLSSCVRTDGPGGPVKPEEMSNAVSCVLDCVSTNKPCGPW